MFTHSIRWRFLFWLGFLLICILTGFGVTAYQLHRNNQIEAIDQELERRVAAVGAALRGPRFVTGHFRGRLEGPMLPPPGSSEILPAPRGPDTVIHLRGRQLPENVLHLFGEDAQGFYFVVWSPGGDRLAASSNAPPNIQSPAAHEPGNRIVARMNGKAREAYYFNTPGECVLAGRSIAQDLGEIRQFGIWLGAAGLAVLALGLGGGWWLATKALQPVHAIGATASRISEGQLHQRINVAETDSELGKLAQVLNETFARLQTAFEQQKQFTADASHELRTPLAVLLSELQTALSRERSGPEYRETLQACLQTVQQMRRLADSLLELARLEAGHEQVGSQEIDLAELARASVDQLKPMAGGAQVSLACDLQPALLTGSWDGLGQVITNLISNAIYYNRTGGSVHLATRPTEEGCLLTVSDTGLGIPKEDLPHIFSRFYRADKSRSRANGRVGLGLAITQAIVHAHHGTIEVESQFGKGTTFLVRFPLTDRRHLAALARS